MKYLLVNWRRYDGSDAAVIQEEFDFVVDAGHAEPAAKLFSTHEEAEEYFNTGLDGWYAIVPVEG